MELPIVVIRPNPSASKDAVLTAAMEHWFARTATLLEAARLSELTAIIRAQLDLMLDWNEVRPTKRDMSAKLRLPWLGTVRCYLQNEQ